MLTRLMKTKISPLQYLITVVLTSAFVWLITANFVLIYIFAMVEYIKDQQMLILDNDFLLLFIWGLPAGLTLSFTGMLIDKYPHYLKRVINISLLGCSISLFSDMFALISKNVFLMYLSVFFIGLFLGSLIPSTHTLYGYLTHWKYRGRVYSFAILIFLILSILFYLVITQFSLDFIVVFFFIALIGLGLSILFYFITKKWLFVVVDEHPTPLMSILLRKTVQIYFISHTLIYFMLGLVIGYFAKPTDYIPFWMIVLTGSAVGSLFSGYISDRWGRRLPIILAVYGIVFSSLVVGVFSLDGTWQFAAFIIGCSFALIHSAIDSALWVDLSPNDSLGRYSTLSFQSFGLGFILGFITSYWVVINPNRPALIALQEIFGLNIFLLIGLGVLAVLPLFFVNDSFPPLEFFLLLVINEGGMPMFHYSFSKDKDIKVDLALISGALTAVGSFMKEATGEVDANLNSISHGSHFIISKATELGLSGAIFANKNDFELQKLLNLFMKGFEEEFRSEIINWKGNVSIFNSAKNDAEKIFGPLVNSKDTIFLKVDNN